MPQRAADNNAALKRHRTSVPAMVCHPARLFRQSGVLAGSHARGAAKKAVSNSPRTVSYYRSKKRHLGRSNSKTKGIISANTPGVAATTRGDGKGGLRSNTTPAGPEGG